MPHCLKGENPSHLQRKKTTQGSEDMIQVPSPTRDEGKFTAEVKSGILPTKPQPDPQSPDRGWCLRKVNLVDLQSESR